MLFQSSSQQSLSALASLLSTAFQDPSNNYTDAYTSGNIKGWTIVNSLTAGGGADQMFAVLTKVDAVAGTVGLSLAKNIIAGTPSGQLASFAEITGLVGPFDFFVVVTPYRVAINILDHSQVKLFTVFACCVDWRVVDTTGTGAGSDPTHLQNLKNNSQVVGKLGSTLTYRLLYAGKLGSNNVYDQLTELESINLFDDISANQQAIPISMTAVTVEPNQLQGILHGAALSDTRVLFNMDRGIDPGSSVWRVFKDTDTSKGIFVRETA